jgi:hypothetical protein
MEERRILRGIVQKIKLEISKNENENHTLSHFGPYSQSERDQDMLAVRDDLAPSLLHCSPRFSVAKYSLI